MTFDVVAFAKQLIPPLLRGAKMLGLTEAYVKPVSLLAADTAAWYPGALQAASSLPNTIVLRGYLNNLFDSSNRGIVINTPDNSGQLTFRDISLTTPIVFNASSTPVVFYANGRNQLGYDFEVVVPVGLASSELEKRIKSVVEQHRLAGKVARFKYDNGTIF